MKLSNRGVFFYKKGPDENPGQNKIQYPMKNHA